MGSDHITTYLELYMGRMQRRQKMASQTKPANIVALRDPAKRIAFAERGWVKGRGLARGPPGGESGEAGGSLSTEALETSRKRERCVRKGGSRLSWRY